MTRTLTTLALLAGLAGAAQAQQLNALLMHDAAQQQRIAQALAAGRIASADAAQLAKQVADMHGLEARLFDEPADMPKNRAQLRTQQDDLDASIRYAETHRVADAHDAADRMHLRVAFARGAEQQRRIAREERRHRLDAPKVVALEKAQARIARAVFEAATKNGETQADADAIQRLQNHEDYAITTALSKA